jgi:hypothetical protein
MPVHLRQALRRGRQEPVWRQEVPAVAAPRAQAQLGPPGCGPGAPTPGRLRRQATGSSLLARRRQPEPRCSGPKPGHSASPAQVLAPARPRQRVGQAPWLPEAQSRAARSRETMPEVRSSSGTQRTVASGPAARSRHAAPAPAGHWRVARSRHVAPVPAGHWQVAQWRVARWHVIRARARPWPAALSPQAARSRAERSCWPARLPLAGRRCHEEKPEAAPSWT